MTENQTPPSVWRIRINTLPTGHEFDEFDVRRFRVDEVYEVPARLGLLLIVSGYAELAHRPQFRDVAADSSRSDRSKR